MTPQDRLLEFAPQLASLLQRGGNGGLWERLAAVCVVAFVLYCWIGSLLPIACLYLAILLTTRRNPSLSACVDHVKAIIHDLFTPPRP
jgi:hypothetical protein